jgi:hypothetical protein
MKILTTLRRPLRISAANLQAPPNVTDKDDMAALAHASENDHAAVVRFLKAKGAMETVAQAEKNP